MSLDGAVVRDLAARLRDVAEVLGGVPGVARRSPDPWTGRAAEAGAAAASRLARRAEGTAEVLLRLAGQLEGHAARAAAPERESGAPVQGALAEDLVHARLALAVEDDLAAPAGAGTVATARATDAALRRVGAAVDPVTGRPVRAHLLAYDPGAFEGEGRVVVAVGDPTTADDVAVLVPGMGTDGRDASVAAGRALALHLAARCADPDDGNAVVAWIGYDAPDGPGVLSERMAEVGGARLADDVDGLRADRAGPAAHLTVIGHSYGSTTVSLAATGPTGLAADDVVLAGSPGAGDARAAADLGLRPGHVWVLRNSLDPVAALGTAGPLGLGEDPALDTWGATRLRAESATSGGPGWPVADHASYFVPGGEGLANLARVVAGRTDQVITAPPLRDPWWSPPLDPELVRPAAPDTVPGAC